MIKNILLISFVSLILVGSVFIGLSFFPKLDPLSSSTKTVINSSGTIKINETITIDNPFIEVTLQDVFEDSRCPVDVVCVWEGDVKILVSISTDNYQADHNMTLNDIQTNKISFLTYYVKFQEINPNLYSNVKLSKEAYNVTLYIGEYSPD